MTFSSITQNASHYYYILADFRIVFHALTISLLLYRGNGLPWSGFSLRDKWVRGRHQGGRRESTLVQPHRRHTLRIQTIMGVL